MEHGTWSHVPCCGNGSHKNTNEGMNCINMILFEGYGDDHLSNQGHLVTKDTSTEMDDVDVGESTLSTIASGLHMQEGARPVVGRRVARPRHFALLVDAELVAAFVAQNVGPSDARVRRPVRRPRRQAQRRLRVERAVAVRRRLANGAAAQHVLDVEVVPVERHQTAALRLSPSVHLILFHLSFTQHLIYIYLSILYFLLNIYLFFIFHLISQSFNN